ncbi:asparagine synthase-related protein [Agrococcus sp. Ld7]|uniref:asparagine synthase-related protein n=1 Tax=Agrococcus sp. Ld7 TaxID=649148 RepID=UPI0038702149
MASTPVPRLPGFLAMVEDAEGDANARGRARVTTWGLSCVASSAWVLSAVTRTADGRVSPEAIAAELEMTPAALVRLFPPFAAVRADDEGVTMVADSMGFRPLFHSHPGSDGAAVLSSSALVAARARRAQLDQVAVGTQSLLGWQLGQRTLFQGVEKLAPGAVARLRSDGVGVRVAPARQPEGLGLDAAVTRAASLLRTSLAAVLDEHPDAVLQLTGGLDSRLLLSAIPPRRRRGLQAMTLDVPGSSDSAIASAIAERYGIRHSVRGLADLGHLTPEAAWEATRDAAERLDAMSDPVAFAALAVAERSFEQGVRISGLGGEVARGFYYVGRVRDRTYTAADASRLARWRMFVNEAVEPGLLARDFAKWALEEAEQEVLRALLDGGPEWFRATDALYLRHRMQRWAGATDTAVGAERIVINPMLDPAFLDIAAGLTPQEKAGSRFLAALQMELDPELGRRPLDGRSAPAAYAHPAPWQPVVQVAGTGRRLAQKALQRVRRGNRSPAGGAVLAGKVVDHWRARPELLDPLAALPFLEQDWLERVLRGDHDPKPSAVGFLTALVVSAPPA